jgi:hypothetical protein
MSNTVVLEPISRTGLASRIVWRPLDSLQGKVVGFIDNSKPNFQLLADDLSELLMTRYGAASVVRHRKRSASIPAPDTVFADVAEKCDLVITGSGD